MVEQQETVTTLSDARERVEEPQAGVEDIAAGTAGKTARGAVSTVVGVLTGGFIIAAAAGFVLGVATGVVVGRRAMPPPPPRWQLWR